MLVRRNADAGPVAAALSARGSLSRWWAWPGCSRSRRSRRRCRCSGWSPTRRGHRRNGGAHRPRWRLGAADLVALWRRAVQLHRAAPAVESAEDTPPPPPPTARLADALADPGPSERLFRRGHRRIAALGAELTRLRGFLAHPLVDLISEVRRVLGVDAEVEAPRGPAPNT